jgi:2-hydroxy-6-oxonona-2,4-dienedioate hydrolase
MIAISAGAWSAVDFAIRYPDRCAALILIVPAAPLPPHTKNFGGPLGRAILESDFVAWAATKLTPLMPATFSRTMLGVEASILREATPGESARLRGILDHLLPISARAAGIAFDIETAALPPFLDLKAIGCPTLAISDADDPLGTAGRASQIAAAAPHAHALIFPTGGHALVGRFDGVATAILDFLANPDGK